MNIRVRFLVISSTDKSTKPSVISALRLSYLVHEPSLANNLKRLHSSNNVSEID